MVTRDTEMITKIIITGKALNLSLSLLIYKMNIIIPSFSTVHEVCFSGRGNSMCKEY